MLREETDTVEVPREAEFCTAQLLVSAYWSLQLPQMTGRSGQCSYDPKCAPFRADRLGRRELQGQDSRHGRRVLGLPQNHQCHG